MKEKADCLICDAEFIVSSQAFYCANCVAETIAHGVYVDDKLMSNKSAEKLMEIAANADKPVCTCCPLHGNHHE